MCKARLKLGIGASKQQTPRILPDRYSKNRQPTERERRSERRLASVFDVTVGGARRRHTGAAVSPATKECVSKLTDSGLCGDVTQVRVGEECPDQSGPFLEPSQGADGLGFEVVLAGDAGLGDPVVLDVLPDPFVGVELG